MKNSLLTCLFFCLAFFAKSQDLYLKTFGKKGDKALIFLHGGPGYNCANFEGTSAKALAEKGFFVIVYDRRGEGRSKDPEAKYTFKQSNDDLNSIYKKYKLKTANLMGHSFGGVVALRFAEAYPQKVESIVLVGAPISLQETFLSIIQKSKAIYESKNDSTSLKYLSMLEKMDKSSLQYSSYCFSNAMKNGFYTPKNMTEEAKALFASLKKDSTLYKQATQMSYEAPQGFWKNESYTSIDLTEPLKKLVQNQAKIYALYGKDDGLYSEKQVADLQAIIGQNRLEYLDNCSHNVFIDQQKLFLEAVCKWLKN